MDEAGKEEDERRLEGRREEGRVEAEGWGEEGVPASGLEGEDERLDDASRERGRAGSGRGRGKGKEKTDPEVMDAVSKRKRTIRTRFYANKLRKK